MSTFEENRKIFEKYQDEINKSLYPEQQEIDVIPCVICHHTYVRGYKRQHEDDLYHKKSLHLWNEVLREMHAELNRRKFDKQGFRRLV